jgi:DNA-binding MarR family transcriptional regulator
MYLFGLLTHVAARAPVSPGALAEDMAISATTIRDQVQWLVDQGLIERRPNPDDARSYLIVPTRKGKELLRRGSPALDRVAELLDAHLDRPLGEIEEAVDAFERALRGLLASSGGSSGARAPRRNRTAAR